MNDDYLEYVELIHQNPWGRILPLAVITKRSSDENWVVNRACEPGEFGETGLVYWRRIPSDQSHLAHSYVRFKVEPNTETRTPERDGDFDEYVVAEEWRNGTMHRVRPLGLPILSPTHRLVAPLRRIGHVEEIKGGWAVTPPTPYVDMRWPEILKRMLAKEVLRLALEEGDGPTAPDSVHGEFGRADEWGDREGSLRDWIAANPATIAEIVDLLLIGTELKDRRAELIAYPETLSAEITEIANSSDYPQDALSERLANAGRRAGRSRLTRRTRRSARSARRPAPSSTGGPPPGNPWVTPPSRRRRRISTADSTGRPVPATLVLIPIPMPMPSPFSLGRTWPMPWKSAKSSASTTTARGCSPIRKGRGTPWVVRDELRDGWDWKTRVESAGTETAEVALASRRKTDILRLRWSTPSAAGRDRDRTLAMSSMQSAAPGSWRLDAEPKVVFRLRSHVCHGAR